MSTSINGFAVLTGEDLAQHLNGMVSLGATLHSEGGPAGSDPGIIAGACELHGAAPAPEAGPSPGSNDIGSLITQSAPSQGFGGGGL